MNKTDSNKTNKEVKLHYIQEFNSKIDKEVLEDLINLMIYKLTNKKELPSRKLGDRRVISSVDLAIYLIGSDR